MYRTFLFWTGALTLGAVAMWIASPVSTAQPRLDRTVCKVRNAVRRRRTRKAPLHRLRACARPVALAHLPRHASCSERR